MKKKSDDFSLDDASRIARSDAGQQLYSALRRKDSDLFQRAMDQAASGNFGQVKQTMSALLEDPEIRELLSRLGGGANE